MNHHTPRTGTLRAQLKALKPHDHLCLVYETRDEWRETVIPFMALGLSRREKCVYVADTSTLDEIRRCLAEEGVDVAFAEAQGQFTLRRATDPDTKNDSFDPDRMIARLVEATEQALREGYPALRVTGEMTGVVRGKSSTERILEYEAKLNRDFFPKYPGSALCQYDRGKFDPEIIWGMVQTHPLLIHKGRIHKNAFYVPTEDYLHHRGAKFEVQNWFNSLDRAAETETRYPTLFEAADDAIFLVRGGVIADCNAAAPALLGCAREAFVGQPLHAFAPSRQPDGSASADAAARHTQAALTGRQERFDWRYRRSDGTTLDVEISLTPIVIEGATGLLGLVRDVTGRNRSAIPMLGIMEDERRTRAMLRESEEQFKTIFNEAPLGIALIDSLTGRFQAVNPMFAKIAGRTVEQMTLIDWMSITHPDDVQENLDNMARLNAGKIAGFKMRKRYLHPDGTAVWVNLTDARMKVEDKVHPRHLCMIEDITETKQMEAYFLHSQRVESVGRLASGIAHDLNNILAPILMATPMLREEAHSDETRDMLNTIETSAERGANIIKQVLAFGRGIEGQRAPLQLRHQMKEMVQIIHETFPKSITLRSHSPNNLWTIIGDVTQLYQVLMNLCINARDAMPQGGTLTLAAENVRLDDTFTGVMGQLPPGPYVFLTVTDTGVGISPENLDKIFEPFFTTKPVGLGTGLGLSMVFSIVKSHGGIVEVASKLGAGTQFSIYLPATDSASLQPSVSEPENLPKGNGELILVVDDEESIRVTTACGLETHGYHPLLARNGKEAIALYASHQNNIRLVMTDLMMPLMDGVAMIRALRTLSPEVKIIVTSGLDSDLMTDEAATLGVNAFLPKPYTVATLLQTLHDTLNGRGVPSIPRPAAGAAAVCSLSAFP